MKNRRGHVMHAGKTTRASGLFQPRNPMKSVMHVG